MFSDESTACLEVFVTWRVISKQIHLRQERSVLSWSQLCQQLAR
jgi:hypothetical protein